MTQPIINAQNYRDIEIEDLQSIIADGGDVNAVDVDGRTALMFACFGHDNLEIIQCLLENGADVNAVDPDRKTALMLACFNHYTRLPSVEEFIKHGADVSLVDSYGWSAFHYACTVGNIEIIKTLGDNGADIHGLITADRHSYKSGTSALILACSVGDFETIKYLVKKGVDISHADSSGTTALSIVEGYENQQLMDYLESNLK